MDRQKLTGLQRELHVRRTQPEIRLVIEILRMLLDNSKETLVRAEGYGFALEQGKAQAYMRLIEMVEQPSPVPPMTEYKNV